MLWFVPFTEGLVYWCGQLFRKQSGVDSVLRVRVPPLLLRTCPRCLRKGRSRPLIVGPSAGRQADVPCLKPRFVYCWRTYARRLVPSAGVIRLDEEVAFTTTAVRTGVPQGCTARAVVGSSPTTPNSSSTSRSLGGATCAISATFSRYALSNVGPMLAQWWPNGGALAGAMWSLGERHAAGLILFAAGPVRGQIV